ncbi:MAG: hypothetical protein AAF249_16735 [Pseudomonadota bacterium]
MRSFASAVALVFLFSAPSLAQDQKKPERIRYATSWFAVEPLAELEGELPKVGEEVEVPRKGIVMAARLAPERTAVLGAAVADAKGKSLAEKDQPLFSLKASSGRVFCTSSKFKGGGFSSFMSEGAQSKHFCFVDANNDGRFESFLKKSSLIKGLPNFTGRTSKRPKSIPNVAYTTKPGKEWAELQYVALEYRGNANPRGNHVFETIFGNAEKSDSLTDRRVVKAKDAPKSVSFLGGSFELISGEKSVARLRVDKPIQAVPFGVNRTVEFRTY